MTRSKKTIVLVGPIAPFRGGIAQYNTQLFNALRKFSDTKAVSFKRQYPKLLYPGQADKEPGKSIYDPNISYVIDVYSPLSLKKAVNTILSYKPDMVLISWWTLFWQPGQAYIAKSLRDKGIKVFYECHNLYDHDATKVVQRVSKKLLKQADGYVIHSDEELKTLNKLAPRATVLKQHLPIFGHYPAPKGKLKKRGRLELLFFGFIRPYKGLDTLVEALATLNDKKIYLTVVGEIWGDAKEIQNRIKNIGAPNLELHFEYVNDKEAAEYFDRSDVVVLPYRSATGSGVATLAFHYGKPVLVTKVGGLKDVVVEGKTGWLVNPDSPRALVKAIRSLDRKQTAATKKHIKEFCKENTWDNLAKNIYGLA